MKQALIIIAAAASLLSGCDQAVQLLGLDEPQRREAKADAEGRAVGSACRQSGRAIEDCYSLYRWLPKASIFAGWREMNDYMLANNLGIVEPKLPPAPGPEDKKKKLRLSNAEGDNKNENKTEEKKPDDKKTGESDEKTAEKTEKKAASENPGKH